MLTQIDDMFKNKFFRIFIHKVSISIQLLLSFIVSRS